MRLAEQRYRATCPTCGDELAVVVTLALAGERVSADGGAVTVEVELVGGRVDAPCGHLEAANG